MKIVLKIEDGSIGEALKLAKSEGFDCKNFFDLAFTHKMLDFWHLRQSLFRIPNPSKGKCSRIKIFFVFL